MSLRKLLGLPPKKSKSAAAPPPASRGDPATFEAAKQKYDQVAGHAGLSLLTDAQRAALRTARDAADRLSGSSDFDDAAKLLNDATGVAAGQIVKAQTAKKEVEAIKPKISVVLDNARLFGVPDDHIKTLRDRFEAIKAKAEADVIAAAAELAALRHDVANDAVIKDMKRARDKVLADKDKVEAAAREALKVPQETPEVLKQHRILADALPKIGWYAGKLNFKEAERYIEICKASTAKIDAEAAGIAAAIILRDKVLADRKLIDAKVKAARLIYGVTDEAKGLTEQFKRMDQAFEGAVIAKDYKIAQTYLKQLESLAIRVLELKPAMQADELERAARQVETDEVQDEYTKVTKIPAVTGEMERIFTIFDAKAHEYFDALNAREYDRATKICAEVKSLSAEYLIAAGEAAAELQKNTEQLDIWKSQCQKRYSAMQKIHATLPAMTAAIADATSAFEDVNAQSTAKDFTAALASVNKLKALLDTIDGLKKANKAAYAERRDAWKEYKKNQTLFEEALAIKPNTKEMAALYKTFFDAHINFHKLRKQGDTSAMGMLPDMIISAQAVVDGKDANIAALEAGRQAATEARDAFKPKFQAAYNLATKYLPASQKEFDEFNALAGEFAALLAAGRYMESIEFTEKRVKVAAQAIMDAEAQWILAAGQAKTDYEARYATVKTDFDKVVAYAPVLPGLAAEIAAAQVLKHEADAEFASDNIGKATAHLDKLEADVAALIAKKGAVDTAVADKQWVDAKKTGIGADVTAAIDDFALLPETQDIQKRLVHAKNIAEVAETGLDFVRARQQWVELERLLALWKAKETDNDNAWSTQATDVHDRLDTFRTERTAVRDITGITPELKKLTAEYGVANSRFWKAYEALDWVLALSLMDEYERAAKALAAKKADYDAAVLAATPVAAAATQELTDISVSDLEAKSTVDKLKLLDDMRATGKKLTKEQRKLQRKLYATLDYDPEFKEADEKRRDELVAALQADSEVTEARGKWGSMDDDARLAVLVKVLNAECKVFNIPAPAVRLFYEPPGSEGFFSPGTMTLNLNTHPDSGWSDYKEAVNTVVHENMHNYQAVLVRRLEEGIITKDDPDYNQALIFAANDAPGGYVPPSEELDPDEAGTKPYKTQPVEAHAWDTGDGVAEDLIAGPKPKKGETL